MGLSESIRRRLLVVEGESFSTSLKIFFSDRKTRRAYEYQKFGRYLIDDDQHAGASMFRSETDAIIANLDPDWYAQAHGLQDPGISLDHYLNAGRQRAFAPNGALAGEDGKTLSCWGLEFIVRCGISVGDTAKQALRPGDKRALDPFGIANPDGKKIAVVTAIFGNYDRLLPVDTAWTDSADFFVFSEQEFESSAHWQQVHSPYHHVDPRRKARFIKLNLPAFFQSYEWVLWVDGNILMCCDPRNVIERVGRTEFDFAVFKHSGRTSVLAEAAANAIFGKENAQELAAHLARVDISSKQVEPRLYETMAMVLRPSSATVQKLFVKWWGYLLKGSKRDQLSLPLAMAEVPEIRFAYLPETIDKSAEFYRTTHLAKADKI